MIAVHDATSHGDFGDSLPNALGNLTGLKSRPTYETAAIDVDGIPCFVSL